VVAAIFLSDALEQAVRDDSHPMDEDDVVTVAYKRLQQLQLSNVSSDSCSADKARCIAELLSIVNEAADVDYMEDALGKLAQYTVRQAYKMQLQQLLPVKKPLSSLLLKKMLSTALVVHKESRRAAAWVTVLADAATQDQLLQLPADILAAIATIVGFPVAQLQHLGCQSAEHRIRSDQLLLRVATAAVQHAGEMMSADGQGMLAEALLSATRAHGNSFGDVGSASSATSNSMAAAAAVPGVSAEPLLQMPQLLQWLRQQGQQEGAASIASMCTLTSELLGTSADYLSQQQSWQLYELLLELQQQPAWQQQQQATGLSTEACNAMIKQQQAPGESADSAAKVLQLLLHSTFGSSGSTGSFKKSAECYEQLSSSSQQVVLAAAVRLGRHAEALQLVLQTAAAGDALPQLLNLWQQQQKQQQLSAAASKEQGIAEPGLGKISGDPPQAEVLQDALSAALQLQLVPAVAQLTQLLPGAAAPGSRWSQQLTIQQVEQCVQLLSSQNAASQAAWEAAQQLVSDCLASAEGAPAFTADTVAAYAAAAAAASQQASVKQQLQKMAGTAVLMQAIMLLAGRSDAAATALLLEAVLSGCDSH
jgi:hypothetical protein